MNRVIVAVVACVVAVVACMTPPPPTQSAKVVASSTDVVASTPTEPATITPSPSPVSVVAAIEMPLPEYIVAATTLNVRNFDGDVVAYFHEGDVVACTPVESGWCLMESGIKVWSGCLDPNVYDFGCANRHNR